MIQTEKSSLMGQYISSWHLSFCSIKSEFSIHFFVSLQIYDKIPKNYDFFSKLFIYIKYITCGMPSFEDFLDFYLLFVFGRTGNHLQRPAHNKNKVNTNTLKNLW